MWNDRSLDIDIPYLYIYRSGCAEGELIIYIRGKGCFINKYRVG